MFMVKLVESITSDNVYVRIGGMVVSFFLLFLLVGTITHFLFPQGILRGKHPLVNALILSLNLWLSTLQIFGYNLIATFLIIGSSLIAEQSRICKDRFIPIGYKVFWVLTIFFGLIAGTNSFEFSYPDVLSQLQGFFSTGFWEFSAYLLVATVAYKITLLYSDHKKIILSRKFEEIKLSKTEKVILVMGFVILFAAAFTESYRILQV